MKVFEVTTALSAFAAVSAQVTISSLLCMRLRLTYVSHPPFSLLAVLLVPQARRLT